MASPTVRPLTPTREAVPGPCVRVNEAQVIRVVDGQGGGTAGCGAATSWAPLLSVVHGVRVEKGVRGTKRPVGHFGRRRSRHHLGRRSRGSAVNRDVGAAPASTHPARSLGVRRFLEVDQALRWEVPRCQTRPPGNRPDLIRRRHPAARLAVGILRPACCSREGRSDLRNARPTSSSVHGRRDWGGRELPERSPRSVRPRVKVASFRPMKELGPMASTESL